MNNLKVEQEFFHFVVKKIRTFVADKRKDVSITKHKGEGDFSTEIDVGVENIIVTEIRSRFPNDLIMAEEGHNDTEITSGRIWIIDPICGTNNLARGIRNYCTNIALAKNGRLVAACVIDHSQDDYFWSVGEGNVHINDVPYVSNNKSFDVLIDVDFGAMVSADKEVKEKYSRFVKKLITETNHYLITLNTSLSFAYTAIGKIDGFVNVKNHPWDIAAASFLVQHAGGVITDLTGKPWTLTSIGAIGAGNREIHKQLLEFCSDF